MNIGIIGTGNMGRALGVRFAALGHKVTFGARRIEVAKEAAELAGENAQAGSIDEAAAFGEVLIWTPREIDPAKVLNDPAILDGKIVVDLNNRNYAVDVREGRWFETAIAEELQANLPNAAVVKALNTIAMEAFDSPPEALQDAGATTFLAGRSAGAKQTVSALMDDLGFKGVDLGDTAAAFRAAEALGDAIRMLIIDQGQGGRAHFSFTLLPDPTLDSIGSRKASNYS